MISSFMNAIRPLFLALVAWSAGAAPPPPQAVLGFKPGEDYKLAGSEQIYGYFRKLAAESKRIRVVEFGRSAMGRPMLAAFISSQENLEKLDRWREISARLALGKASPEEARALASEGKAVVWIDSGLHASEVAPAQHSPELAYRMVTQESAEVQAIRQNVILIQIPVINPDGLDMIVSWYGGNVGTPYELAPLPKLYQKYAGHDNNRDWFMLNLEETRHVSKLLFRDWFPQIVYNQHQAPRFPARIFVPPYAEPLNPHIPAPVMEGIHLIGAAITERMARENKPGVLSYYGFDAWWNGGLRSTPAFHNMHGILTETALHAYATPKVYGREEIPSAFPNGIPAREPSVFYQRPWLGGKWGVRDAIEYMLTADFAILDLAASRKEQFLYKGYELARAAIAAGAAGGPYAYVAAPAQWDRGAAAEMFERLALAGIAVERASAAFTAGGKQYPEGSVVLRAAQPFRAYLMDLFEPQKYPEIRASASGPLKQPYDLAGWTLPMQMGIAVDRIEEPFTAPLAASGEWRYYGSVSGDGPLVTLDHRENSSFLATAFVLERGEPVRWTADSTVVLDSVYVENRARAENFARQFGVSVTLCKELPGKAVYTLRRPRVGLYESWTANIDGGWTQWLLDRYQIPYTLLHNADIAAGKLSDRFDSVILPSQAPASILNGSRDGEYGRDPGNGIPPSVLVQRPEYAGGIGVAGAAQLEAFTRAGGTLIALDEAAGLPIDSFPLPVRNLAGSGSAFSSPGSLLRFSVDTSHPIGFGMPLETIGMSTGGSAFSLLLAPAYNRGEREARSIVSFARARVLASGWLSGENTVAGKDALLDLRHGKGRVILFGFRPQFRGQTFGTFRLLLNAIYRASANPE